jgi:spoIIIJ-associated protein
MVKIEALTLEEAYKEAASKLSCSLTELNVEVVQFPNSGFLGMFKKSAIIVATVKDIYLKERAPRNVSEKPAKEEVVVVKEELKPLKKEHVVVHKDQPPKREAPKRVVEPQKEESKRFSELNETIMPESFVTGQDDEEFDENDYENSPYRSNYTQSTSHIVDSFFQEDISDEDMIDHIKYELNALFKNICFSIGEVSVSLYDDSTILVEFSGEDAALLIGKEGYRYKALSYMIFNWINAKYGMQLRLEIAEFLKNQEENIDKYLEGVYEIIDRDGRAQTKILDGVLIQIALKKLRQRYSDKYVAIRSTRDGNRYIMINDYNNY